MADAKRKTAVLISGRGTNLAALIAAASAETYPARIVLVIADSPDADGLRLAKDAKIETVVIDRRRCETKAEFEMNLDATLRDAGAEIVCLAGFMRILSARFVSAWHDQILNIHPSLLPLFPGLETHEQAIAAGVRLHGATVHFVRPETDTGPIVTQGAVPVLSDDTPDSLAARVLKIEHRIYPVALELVASGRAKVSGNRVKIDGAKSTPDAMLVSPPD